MDFLDKILPNSESDIDYQIVGMRVDFANQVYSIMEAQGIPRKLLARRMGVGASDVGRILRGDSSLTMKTLLGVARGLGCRLVITLEPGAANA